MSHDLRVFFFVVNLLGVPLFVWAYVTLSHRRRDRVIFGAAAVVCTFATVGRLIDGF